MFWIGLIVGIVIGAALLFGAMLWVYTNFLKTCELTHDEWLESCEVVAEASMDRESRLIAVDEDGEILAEYTFKENEE